MDYSMSYGQPSVFVTLAKGIFITVLAYGAFPTIFAICKPKISVKSYRWICLLVNFAVYLCFAMIGGNYNAAPYVLWTLIFISIFKRFLPKTEPPIDYSKMEKKSFDEIAASIPEEVMAQCKSHRGSRDGITKAAESFVNDGVIPPEYVPALVEEYMKPAEQRKEPAKEEKGGNEPLKSSSSTYYVAAVLVLSVLVVVLVALLASAPTKEDVAASYNSGYEVGYDSAMEEIKAEIPKDILAENYLNLINDTGFDIMLNLEDDGVIPTLDRYFIDGTESRTNAREAYFQLADACEDLMWKFAEIIVD